MVVIQKTAEAILTPFKLRISLL
jgi:hypothetical protein